VTIAITSVASVAPLPPVVSGWLGYSLSYRLESAAISGPAQTMCQTPKHGGAAQILALREILAAEAKHHRNQRRSKQASLTEAELRALNNRIFKAGLAAKRAADDRAI